MKSVNTVCDTEYLYNDLNTVGLCLFACSSGLSITELLTTLIIYCLPQKKWKISNYPVYHSVHDTFYWMKNFVDRDFEYHKTLTQLWLQIALTLTDQPLLPFNCSQYAHRLTYYAKDIKNKYEKVLTQHNISIGK